MALETSELPDDLLREFWTSIIRDLDADYRDRLKASEYLAKFFLSSDEELVNSKDSSISITVNSVSASVPLIDHDD